MAKIDSTPGVHIEEENAFPNSVVAVATAVPAFIGHTEKAARNKKDVTHEPVRISSFGEYLQFFGGSPNTTYEIESKVGGAGFELKEPSEPFLLYNSIKLFYANGGADCYIVSVGNYKDDLAVANFFGRTPENKPLGITALLKYIEPTMLVVPDAVLFDTIDKCAAIQTAMINHCGLEMRSRIAILDVYAGDQDRTMSPTDVVTVFREKIGSNFLDFATAYYPWLHTTITSSNNISFENIKTDQFENLINILKGDIDKSIKMKVLDGERGRDIKVKVEEIKTYRPYLLLDEITSRLNTLSQSEISKVNNSCVEEEDPTITKIDELIVALETSHTKINTILQLDTTTGTEVTNEAAGTSPHPISENYAAYTTSFNEFKGRKSNNFSEISTPLENMKKSLKEALSEKPSTKALHETLLAVHPLYKSIINSITEKINLLPPSSAMAGVYTMVDNTIGVFQSPANVSLGSVVKPAVNISENEQDDLNVPLNGKAVNAIRSFPGKGILVWGARTLDGNSLDWRFLSVRRTVIMIEQSIKNAAEAYVFEPNVSGTWANLDAMITNFLTNVWSQGGLAGAVPADAFSVEVGLGKTMTPLDISEGIMRISVKVAVTRPAEFIIITFEQQMQKS